MTSKTTKCLYCRRRYQQAAAYGKHLLTMHPDITLSLHASADQTLPRRTAFVHGENENQPAISITNRPVDDRSDSDYESDPGREIIDCDSASDESDNDMQHDSDAEDILQPPNRGSPSSQQTIPGAGRILGNAIGYVEHNQAMTDDPWSPFSSESDFNLASWFVCSKVSKSKIDDYFRKDLGERDAGSFQSAFSLRKQLEVLDPFGEYLTWTEATMDDGKHSTTFYYRNVIDCVRYLIRQIAYRPDMVYAPIREYDSSGDRLYSEMHTADWWWETQVRNRSVRGPSGQYS
jgi:hypothetical protein